MEELFIRHFCVIVCFMTITQTVEIPADHRITLEVPRQIPAGKTIIAFTPVNTLNKKKDPSTMEEALQMLAEQTSDPDRKPISHYFGILSPKTYGDGVAYQRAIRDEWD